MKLLLVTCSAAVTLVAQSFEIEPFHSGQDEVSASLAFYDAERGNPYVGMSVNIGTSLTNHFTALGEFDVVSLEGIILTGYEAGGRVNLTRRGRFIPYVVSTGGLLHASTLGVGANGFGFGVGAGAIVRANNHIDLKFEVKENQITTLGGFALFHWYTTATVGVGYRFDRPNDEFDTAKSTNNIK